MKEYKIKQRNGIDNLQSTAAFIGNSQGDRTHTNDIQRYKDSDGWLSYVFGDDIDKTDQRAINTEAIRREKENEKIVEDLKRTGKYGEEYEISIKVKPCALFDNSYPDSMPMESYKFVLLNLKK
jgi:hypothetical protein